MNDSETDRPRGYSLAEGAPKPPTRTELERLLLNVEIEEACRIKWRWGVQEYRGGDESKPFDGDKLTELHSEGLDALNYLQLLMDEGVYDHECLEQLRTHALGIVRGARLLANGVEPDG